MFCGLFKKLRFFSNSQSKGFFHKSQNLSRNRNYNFYDVLGVTRKCSNSEIEKAFISLAKQYHPDFNSDPLAAEKYQEISKAYEALNNEMNRGLYDAYMDIDPYSLGGEIKEEDFDNDDFEEFMKKQKERNKTQSKRDSSNSEKNEEDQDHNEFVDGLGNTFKSRNVKYQKGDDVYHNIEIDLEDVFHGNDKIVSYKVNEKCSECHGNKSQKGERPSRCFHCDGNGRVNISQFQSKVCSQCGGEGIIIRNPCQKCLGKGFENRLHSEVVTIPKGIESESKLRIEKKGHCCTNLTNPRGDLVLKVLVRENNRIRREMDNLVVKTNVSLSDAIAGNISNDVEIFGEKINFNMGKKVENGTKICVKNKGMPILGNLKERGDLILDINVVIPNNDKLRNQDQSELKRILSLIN